MRFHGKRSCQILHDDDGGDQRKATPTLTYCGPYPPVKFSAIECSKQENRYHFFKASEKISKYFIQAAALRSQHLVTSRAVTDRWDVARPNRMASRLLPRNGQPHGRRDLRPRKEKIHEAKAARKTAGTILEKEAAEIRW